MVLLGLGCGVSILELCAAVGEGGYFSFEFFSAQVQSFVCGIADVA